MPKTTTPQTNDESNTLFAQSAKEMAIANAEKVKAEADAKAEKEYMAGPMNIYKKMAIATVRVGDQVKGKSGDNKFSNFKYLQLTDFLPIAMHEFEKLGLFSKFQVLTEVDSNGVPMDTAYLTIVNTDNPQEKIVYSSRVADASKKGNTEIQNLGAAHSYIKRYLYMDALCLAIPDELDGHVGDGTLETRTAMISPQSKGILNQLCMELPEKAGDMLKKYSVNSISELTQEQALQAIRAMQIYQKRKNNGNGNSSLG